MTVIYKFQVFYFSSIYTKSSILILSIYNMELKLKRTGLNNHTKKDKNNFIFYNNIDSNFGSDH